MIARSHSSAFRGIDLSTWNACSAGVGWIHVAVDGVCLGRGEVSEKVVSDVIALRGFFPPAHTYSYIISGSLHSTPRRLSVYTNTDVLLIFCLNEITT